MIRLILLLLSFSLVACNSGYVKKDPALVSPTHGYVMVNMPREPGALVFKSAKGKQSYIPIDRNSDFSGIWLPEGDYELTSISTLLAPYKVKGLYPKVKIRAGKITDMGSLVNFPVGELKMVWLPVDLPDQQKKLEETLTEFQAYVDSTDVIRWTMDEVPEPVKGQVGQGSGALIQFLIEQEYLAMDSDLQADLLEVKDIEEFYTLAVRLLPPTWYFQPESDAQGNLYYATDLGHVRKRTPDAIWSGHGTGSQYPITALHQNNGILYAGDDNGALFESRDHGETWTKLLQLETRETIHDIDTVNDSLYIVADKFDKSNRMSTPERATRIYELNNGELKGVVREFRHSEIFSYRQIKAEVYGGTYFIGIHREIFEKLDIATGQWQSVDIPGMFNTYNLSPVDGTITLYTALGMAAKPYVSSDMGKTWSKPKAPDWNIEDVFFSEPGKGVAHSYSAMSRHKTLQEFDAKRNRWIEVAQAPEFCRYLAVDADHRARFCVAENNYIFGLKDGKWLVETIQ